MATLGGQAVKLAVNIIGIVVLSRLLTPDDFGLIAMVTSLTGIALVLKDMGLSAATIQNSTITNAQVNSLFWVNAAVGAIICLLVILSAQAFVWFYGQPKLVPIVFASAAAFLIGGVSVQHQALLSRRMEFLRLALVDISSMVLGTLFGVGLALAGCGYWSLVAMQLVTVASATGFLWIASRWRPSFPSFDRSALNMISFGAHLTGINLLNYIAINVSNILIGRFWGAQQLGLFTRAYQLLLLPLNQINGPVSAVAIPVLSRLVAEPERYRRAYLEILNKILWLTIPGIAFLVATSNVLLAVTLGPQWTQADALYAWLSTMGFVIPLRNTVTWLFITQGRTSELFRFSCLDSIVTVVTILIGLPWGPVGISACFSIAGLLIRTPLLLWLVGRRGPVKTTDLYRALVRAIPLGIAVWLVIWLVKPHLLFMSPPACLTFLFLIAAVIVMSLTLATGSGRSVVREITRLIRERIRRP